MMPVLAASELPPYDDSFNSRIGLTLSGLRDPVHAIQLSPDGRYLAVGNDGGNLEIRNTEPGWERTRIYKAKAKIRAILWHPSQEKSLFIGCGNGNIYHLSFQVEETDKISFGRVNGFVHALALNAETNQLAVGFANSVVVIDKPFPTSDDLGNLKYLTMPALEVKNGSRIGTTTYTLPRNLHYLSAEVLLVIFFGDVGIVAYSTQSGDQLWKMDMSGSWAGSSALSPSREHLVVTDLMRGVDWYSLSHRRFMMSTQYGPSEEPYRHNMVVGIAFLDQSTVVVGHNCGKIIFCPFGMTQKPPVLKVGQGYQAIQTLCCGVVNGATHVVAMVPVDEQDEKQPHIEIAPIITIVRFQNQTKFAGQEKEHSDIERESTSTVDVDVDVDVQAVDKLKLTEMPGQKRLTGVGWLTVLASIVIFSGIWQYWPWTTDSASSQSPIHPSTITKTKTTMETTTETETITATETSTATGMNIARETAIATERATVTESSTLVLTEKSITTKTITLRQTITAIASTYVETATVLASPDCVCTVTSTILDDSVNISEGVDEEVGEEVDDIGRLVVSLDAPH